MKQHMAKLAVIVALALCAVTCSSSPSGFSTTFNGTVAIFGTDKIAFTVTKAGSMTVKLTWSNGSVDLDLYLTTQSCVGYPPVNCLPLLENAGLSTGTTEQFVHTVTNGNTFFIWVDNFSNTLAQAYTVTVTIP